MANVREGHIPTVRFFILDCAAPPLSCELVSNEMEMFSGLPGDRPLLCSKQCGCSASGGVAFLCDVVAAATVLSIT